ncbi:DUF1294 domain-containing protein [Sulfurimonas sp.]|uniref:DUF1294 domain-containing protein n=1 Tax=Sulfurimonas sp. TaxID=2022749 RepID=UPI002B46F32F|nr:DUF1294 domain-containing protein [Sulfurimonas sp.]
MVHIDFTLTYFEVYLLCSNLLASLLYGYDKLLALNHSKIISRISENKLLFTTLIGGTVGAILSMFIFRHKIRKPSFMIKFSLVVIIQLGVIFLYIKGIFSGL